MLNLTYALIWRLWVGTMQDSGHDPNLTRQNRLVSITVLLSFPNNDIQVIDKLP